MSDGERELERGGEHRVTPLELFFDLVLVFAFTQVTRLLADDPTSSGVLRGMLVLAALWFAWNANAWLTSATDVDEGGIRLAMLASMGAMLVVALAVPGAFGDDAVLIGVAYLLVRLPSRLSAIVGRDDADRRGAAALRSDRDRQCVAARARWLPLGGRADRGVGGGAGDRRPRPGRGRHGARPADRRRAPPLCE
jgi:low temperature requirement protein LtrA